MLPRTALNMGVRMTEIVTTPMKYEQTTRDPAGFR
jgi:hypothetical protein